MIWNDGVLDFHVFGWGPVVVRRYLDGDQLVWEYADGSVTRMDRICVLPEDQKIPQPRGPRGSLSKTKPGKPPHGTTRHPPDPR